MLLQERHRPIDVRILNMSGQQGSTAAHALGIGVPIFVSAEHVLERGHEARRLRLCRGAVASAQLVASILGRQGDVGRRNADLAH